MPLCVAIRFESDRFDYSSELPEEYNAGNRFYGRDLAEFLATNLTEQGYAADFLDEDWGWLVFTKRGTAPEFELAIYNLAAHGEGGRLGVAVGEWGLWIRSYEKRKLLGFVPRRIEVQVPQQVLLAIQAAVNSSGSQAESWQDGPSHT